MNITQRQRVKDHRTEMRAFVSSIREATFCEQCGGQPIEWHRPEHAEHPYWRVSVLVSATCSRQKILDEISRCTALCRRCRTTDAMRKAVAASNAGRAVPAIERFDQLYDVAENGCWLWKGCIQKGGYGRFVDENGLVTYAHRFSYEHFVGPIPVGFVIDHLCRTRHCVNPSHLEAVTCRENLLRGEGLTGKRSRQTHCVHGHVFDEANTGRAPNGTRFCWACRRKSEAA